MSVKTTISQDGLGMSMHQWDPTSSQKLDDAVTSGMVFVFERSQVTDWEPTKDLCSSSASYANQLMISNLTINTKGAHQHPGYHTAHARDTAQFLN